MTRYGHVFCGQLKRTMAVVRVIFILSLCVELPRVTAIVAFNGTLVKVNTEVSLQCQGNSVPMGVSNDILWFRNDKQLVNSEKYKIVNVDGNSTLTVRTSGESDVGVYKCSQYGYEAFPHMLSKPVVTKLPTSVIVISGDNLDVTCTGWGWPTPYVLWTREDYFNHIFGVDDPGVDMLNVTTDHGLSLVRAKLRIDGMNSTDQKRYMCVLVNEVGFVNTTTYVRVKDRLASVWPFIGIVIEVVLIVALIVFGEIKRRKNGNKVTESKTH